ncbi:hypothetical protein Tco_0370921 [Tanacetum coccineum]
MPVMALLSMVQINNELEELAQSTKNRGRWKHWAQMDPGGGFESSRHRLVILENNVSSGTNTLLITSSS